MKTTIGIARRTSAVRLLDALLPIPWPQRAAAIETAERADARRDGDASAALLDAWCSWRSSGQLPADAALRDLLGVLGLLLGGVASEMRFRPRTHVRMEGPC